jgi:hypothetical protein
MAWVSPVDTIWRVLRRPWLLVGSGVVVILLLTCALLLPQLPGQMSRDPTAASRWLVGVSADYGATGALLRGLGLFNVLHSFLIQLVLAVITLILCVYLGELLAALVRYRRLPAVLTMPLPEPASPLPLPPILPVYRRRVADAQPPELASARMQEHLAKNFEQVTRTEVPFTAATDAQAPEAGQPATGAQEAGPESAPPALHEVRLLATRHLRWAYVRLALMAGLLLAIAVVWWIVLAGWEVTSPLLAPGEEYRLPTHGLELHYGVTPGEGQVAAQLGIQVAGATITLPVTSAAATTIAGVDLRTTLAAPGLYITTADGTPALARAGQSETQSGLGLTFPTPGSEESVILPALAVGLRIVRMADSDGPTRYLLERYEGDDSQPTERIEIEPALAALERVTIGETSLQFSQFPGITVDVRYLPGVRLLWLAVGLVLLGGLGFWFQPAFVLAQIGPWPVERSVVILQSDVAAAIEPLPEPPPAQEEAQS